MIGAAKHRWINKSWKDIIRVIDDQDEGGFYAASFQFHIGPIALRRHLRRRGYHENYGLKSPVPLSLSRRVETALATKAGKLDAQNQAFRVEIEAMRNMRIVMSQNGDGLHIVVKEG